MQCLFCCNEEFLFMLNFIAAWPVWLNGRAFAHDPNGHGFESRPVRFQCNSLGQAAHTHVPLSPSSIIWYRPMGGDALRLGR